MELIQSIFCLPYFWIFSLVFALIQEKFFWDWKPEIFDWNPETGLLYPKVIAQEGKPVPSNKNNEPTLKKEWVDRKKVYRDAHCSWKIYRFILELIGIFIGWNFIYFFIIKFISLEINPSTDLRSLWNLLLVLIVGLIGISGRIPVIIDSVQDWFKR